MKLREVRGDEGSEGKKSESETKWGETVEEGEGKWEKGDWKWKVWGQEKGKEVEEMG